MLLLGLVVLLTDVCERWSLARRVARVVRAPRGPSRGARRRPALAGNRARPGRPGRPRARLRGIPQLVGRAAGGLGACGVKRWAVIAVQVAAAVLVGLAIRELWVAARGEGDTVGTPARAVSVTSTIEPDVVAFGTPVVATADVVADTTVVEPRSIACRSTSRPTRLRASPRSNVTSRAGTTHVVFRYTLRCLREGCEPAGARGVAQFEPGLVRYRFRGSPGGRAGTWSSGHRSSSRRASPAPDVEAIRWRASRTDLPAVTTRVGPKGLAVVLLLGALALLAGAVWLGRRLWHVPVRAGRDGTRARPTTARARARACARRARQRSRAGRQATRARTGRRGSSTCSASTPSGRTRASWRGRRSRRARRRSSRSRAAWRTPCRPEVAA